MENKESSGLFISASEKLKIAVEQERQKPKYASAEHDPVLTFWLALAVKREHPEAFDFNNPADQIIWTLLGNE